MKQGETALGRRSLESDRIGGAAARGLRLRSNKMLTKPKVQAQKKMFGLNGSKRFYQPFLQIGLRRNDLTDQERAVKKEADGKG
jgi:hypothetical protein